MRGIHDVHTIIQGLRSEVIGSNSTLEPVYYPPPLIGGRTLFAIFTSGIGLPTNLADDWTKVRRCKGIKNGILTD